ncbi:MAG: mechanosensitive ion channel domain-containing protein, partial [Planctomycetota bacterium]
MSFNKTRTLSGMLTFGLFGLSSGVLNAQDVGESGQKAGEALSGIVNTITQAFQGGEAGEAARYELIQMAGTACFVLAVLVISYMIASAVGRFVGGQVTKRVDVTLGKFLSKAIRNLLMLVVVMVALDTFAGIDITAFAAILAALGFAIGMALQGTLGNFAAGIMLLVFRPFKIGDYIVVAGTQGTVEEIDLFTTRLNTPDNRHVIVPNN